MDKQHDNPDNWKFGLFYFNKNDNRIFVPKRNPAFGVTLNFANPYSMLINALIIALIWLSCRASGAI